MTIYFFILIVHYNLLDLYKSNISSKKYFELNKINFNYILYYYRNIKLFGTIKIINNFIQIKINYLKCIL